jgi:adenylylsulfate kinase-like enzyme
MLFARRFCLGRRIAMKTETPFTVPRHMWALLVSHGVPVVCDATANRRVYRDYARSVIKRFVEVYVDCPVDVCITRDPKSLYQKAQSGALTNMPGVQSPYEAPDHPELGVRGDRDPPTWLHGYRGIARRA